MPWGNTTVKGGLDSHESAISSLQSASQTHTEEIESLQAVAVEGDKSLFDLRFAAAQTAIHAAQLDRTLIEERFKVTLTNTLAFPFNSTLNSPTTIALSAVRDNTEYSVEPEVLSHTGPVGEIEVTEKARNGFKITYSGSGSSVTLLVKVKGGMS